jgi:membrane-associated phospholipid phosphatase
MPFALRRIRWAFCMATALNAVMLLSTPTVGGHYLADTVAGVLLALISIALTTAIRRGIERKLGQGAEITIAAPHQPLQPSSSHA